MRPRGFPWTHRLDASNPLLQPTFAHEHPPQKHPLWRLPAERRGENPAGVLLRDPPRAWRRRRRSRKTPDHLAVIRPPTAPCLTARRRLRADRLSRMRSRAARKERSSFFGCFTLRRSNPLTPPPRLKRGTCERSGFPTLFPLPRAARQCCPPSRVRGAFRRGSPKRAPSRAPAWSSAPAGRRAQMLHVFIDVRKPRLDRSSRRCRVRFLAACASTTSADRCFNEHCHGPPEHPGPAESVVGTAADSIDRCLSIDGDRRGYAGSGAEDHRASALPPGIAPGRDFAPTPIASGTSCRGHLPSPCQELTRGTDEAASAAHASKA